MWNPSRSRTRRITPLSVGSSSTTRTLYKSAEGKTELDPGPHARLALDLVPAAREHGPFPKREQSQVSREVVAVRDDEAFSVVCDHPVDRPLHQRERQLDPRCPRMLLD